MANFCNTCATMLNEETGKCPVCDKIEKISGSEKEKGKKQSNKNKKNTRFSKKYIILIVAILVVVIILGGVLLFFIKDKAAENSDKITPPDAEKYFADNSTIVNEIDANKSKNVSTEEKVCETLENRGFTQYAITAEFTMNGEYYEATEVDAASSEKHPMYQTYYVTQNEEIWSIVSINGVILANPVSYNLSSSRGVKVIISETETITSYDSTTNKFYETIPNDTALIVIKVDEISSETLDKLTVKEIDNYD